MITINAGAFIKSMAAARRRFARLVTRAVLRAAELARDHAKASTAFEDRTGNLRDSIEATPTGNFSAKAFTDSPYAHWVERGNGFSGDYIYPKNGQFLKFEINGETIFARRVRTSRPRLFMEQAGDFATPRFEDLCIDAVNHMFE